MSHYGVDVSSNNRHPIDWPVLYTYLANLGGGAQPFAIIKISQGTGYINTLSVADIPEAKAAGFAVSGYLMDQGNANVLLEETIYKAHAIGLTQTNDIELPEGDTVAAYIGHAKLLVAQNPNAPSYLNQSEEDEGFPVGAGVWEANYNGRPGIVHKAGALIHQYTSTGSVPGIPVGVFDLNLFLGTEAQFATLFSLNPVAATSLPPVASPPAPTTKEHNMIAWDPVTGGYWAARSDGSVYSFGTAPYLGGLNNHPDWNAGGAADPCVGIAPYGPGGGSGYVLITDSGAGTPANYEMPRSGVYATS